MNYFIPRSYYYRVNINGIGEIGFSEVSGLASEMQTEDLIVGGVNHIVYKLPVRVKHPNLVLKKSFKTRILKNEIYDDSSLKTNFYQNWISKILDKDANLDNKFIANDLLKNIQIDLVDPDDVSLMTWEVVGAYPVKWQMSNLNAKESALAIETIEFVYQSVNFQIS